PVSRNGAFSNGCLCSRDNHEWPVLHAGLFGRASVVAETLRVFGTARFPAHLDISRISPVAGAIRNLVCDRLFAVRELGIIPNAFVHRPLGCHIPTRMT